MVSATVFITKWGGERNVEKQGYPSLKKVLFYLLKGAWGWFEGAITEPDRMVAKNISSKTAEANHHWLDFVVISPVPKEYKVHPIPSLKELVRDSSNNRHELCNLHAVSWNLGWWIQCLSFPPKSHFNGPSTGSTTSCPGNVVRSMLVLISCTTAAGVVPWTSAYLDTTAFPVMCSSLISFHDCVIAGFLHQSSLYSFLLSV